MLRKYMRSMSLYVLVENKRDLAVYMSDIFKKIWYRCFENVGGVGVFYLRDIVPELPFCNS
jgi:hypothetical protein